MCACVSVIGGQQNHLTSSQTLAHRLSSYEVTERMLLRAHAIALAIIKNTNLLGMWTKLSGDIDLVLPIEAGSLRATTTNIEIDTYLCHTIFSL